MSVPADLEATLREIVARVADCPEVATEPIDVDSLGLVQLVEEIEDHFDVTVRAADVTPDNFGTLASLLRFTQGLVSS